MSIIHHTPPPAAPAGSADSVTAYLAFIADHDPDAGSWTVAEVREYSSFVTKVSTEIRQAGPGMWTVPGRSELGESEQRFTSALAAALWLELRPVSA